MKHDDGVVSIPGLFYSESGMIDFGSINTDTYYTMRPEPPETSSDGSTQKRLQPENSDKNAFDAKTQNSSDPTVAQDLSTEEIRELTDLKQRDMEVRTHEQAHIAAGGSYVRSGAQFEYEKGPDGKKYAVGGEVQIDTSKVPGDPEATLKKMQAVRSAAMAPASPSAQDRRVAAEAAQLENKARFEILTQRYEEAAALQSETSENEDTDTSGSPSRAPAISLGGLIDITQ